MCLDRAGASQGAVWCSSSRVQPLCHCLFTIFPVNALLYGCYTGASVERSGNLLVFLLRPPPPSHPTQPTQQERWRYSHKWEKNKTKPVMYSKWRKHVYLKSEGEIPGKSVTSCCWKGRSKEIWKGRCSYTRPVGWDSGGNVHNGKIKKCSLMRGGWDEQ